MNDVFTFSYLEDKLVAQEQYHEIVELKTLEFNAAKNANAKRFREQKAEEFGGYERYRDSVAVQRARDEVALEQAEASASIAASEDMTYI